MNIIYRQIYPSINFIDKSFTNEILPIKNYRLSTDVIIYRQILPSIHDFLVVVTVTRKCDCSFKFWGKPNRNGLGWVLKLLCHNCNHELVYTLVDHSCTDRLKLNEYSMHIDMTKSLIKLSSILLTLKENNEENLTAIKQLYNVQYSYKRSQRGWLKCNSWYCCWSVVIILLE